MNVDRRGVGFKAIQILLDRSASYLRLLWPANEIAASEPPPEHTCLTQLAYIHIYTSKLSNTAQTLISQNTIAMHQSYLITKKTDLHRQRLHAQQPSTVKIQLIGLEPQADTHILCPRSQESKRIEWRPTTYILESLFVDSS
jgi:hypothetical protein